MFISQSLGPRVLHQAHAHVKVRPTPDRSRPVLNSGKFVPICFFELTANLRHLERVPSATWSACDHLLIMVCALRQETELQSERKSEQLAIHARELTLQLPSKTARSWWIFVLSEAQCLVATHAPFRKRDPWYTLLWTGRPRKATLILERF